MSKKLKLKRYQPKVKLDRYCNQCESFFTCFIESEGVKYKQENHCPVCGYTTTNTNYEEEKEFKVKEF